MRRANLFFSFLPLFKAFKACNILLSSFHSPSLPMSLPMITPELGKKVVMTNLLTHTPMKLRDSLYTLSHLESVYEIQKNNMFLVGDTLHSESLQEWINGGDDREGHDKDDKDNINPKLSVSLSLSLHTLFENVHQKGSMEKLQQMPRYLPYSLYHYQHLYQSHYGNKISFEDYCLLEKELASVLKMYLQDTSQRTFFFVFSDPDWMSPESLLSFLSNEERLKLTRYLVIDLDSSGEELHFLPSPVEHKLYVWEKYSKPFL
jgi:hypothetical protein